MSTDEHFLLNANPHEILNILSSTYTSVQLTINRLCIDYDAFCELGSAVSVGPFVFAIMATANNTVITIQCNTQDSSLNLTYKSMSCIKGGWLNLTLNENQAVQVICP